MRLQELLRDDKFKDMSAIVSGAGQLRLRMNDTFHRQSVQQLDDDHDGN